MTEGPGMQQWHKESMPIRAVMSGKQGDVLCGPWTNYQAGNHEVHRWVFREDSKNECQDIVQEPATSKWTKRLHAAEGPEIQERWLLLEIFAHTHQKRRNCSMP
jgi:hypothetical protein